MLIVDFDGLPSWYTKCPWVGVVEGTGSGKTRQETKVNDRHLRSSGKIGDCGTV